MRLCKFLFALEPMCFLLEKWTFVLDNYPRFFILYGLKGGLANNLATRGEGRGTV